MSFLWQIRSYLLFDQARDFPTLNFSETSIDLKLDAVFSRKDVVLQVRAYHRRASEHLKLLLRFFALSQVRVPELSPKWPQLGRYLLGELNEKEENMSHRHFCDFAGHY